MIEGMQIFRSEIFSDDRGFSSEIFSRKNFTFESDLNLKIDRTYLSTSMTSVLRGLHIRNGEQKYITCLTGCVQDVTLDLRPDSKTFRELSIIELLPMTSLYLPAGIAHGTLTISDNTQILYLLNSEYDATKEIAINILDPLIGFTSPMQSYIRSSRDLESVGLIEYLEAESRIK